MSFGTATKYETLNLRVIMNSEHLRSGLIDF